jgi:hypothetical protein
MKLTVELTVTSNTDEITLGQFMQWAKVLEGLASVKEGIASVKEAITEIKVPASGVKRVPQEQGTPSDKHELDDLPSEFVEVDAPVPPVAVQPSTGNGAAEPAPTAPTVLRTESATLPRRRGPKTKAEKAAIAAAAAASAQPAAPVAAIKRPLPGTTSVETPIPAAMPVVEPAEDGAEVSFADLQECYRQSVSLKGPKLAYQIMARETWPDGTDKEGHPKKWYTVEAVPPNHYERLIQEISAAMGV